MRYYCTYFDRFYLLRALALYRSLKAHGQPFTLWALCFDEHSYDILCRLAQPDLRPIALEEFERDDAPLRAAKSTRSKIEYYFTCTPSLPLFLLNQFPQVDLITYLDADLCFFASPEPVFDELGDNSVLIVEHRFPSQRPEMLAAGIYNVEWLTFRNDAHGRACLTWWRERCLEWCYDRMEANRFADQKYLDDWPSRFEGVTVLQNKGAGLAPWNWMNSRIVRRDGRVLVDRQPLVFFHYHGLKIFRSWLYDPVAEGRVYGEMPLWLRGLLYPPYIQCLKETLRWARQTVPELAVPYTDMRTQSYDWRKMLRKIGEGRLMLTYGLK